MKPSLAFVTAIAAVLGTNQTRQIDQAVEPEEGVEEAEEELTLRAELRATASFPSHQ